MINVTGYQYLKKSINKLVKFSRMNDFSPHSFIIRRMGNEIGIEIFTEAEIDAVTLCPNQGSKKCAKAYKCADRILATFNLNVARIVTTLTCTALYLLNNKEDSVVELWNSGWKNKDVVEPIDVHATRLDNKEFQSIPAVKFNGSIVECANNIISDVRFPIGQYTVTKNGIKTDYGTNVPLGQDTFEQVINLLELCQVDKLVLDIGEHGFMIKSVYTKTSEVDSNIANMVRKIRELHDLQLCPSKTYVITADKIYCPSCNKVFVDNIDGKDKLINDALNSVNTDMLRISIHHNGGLIIERKFSSIDEVFEKEEIEQYNRHKEEINLQNLIINNLRVNGKSTNREIATAIGMVGQTVLRVVLKLVDEGIVLVDKSTSPNMYMLSTKGISCVCSTPEEE